MSNNVLPMPVGSSVSNASLASLLGQVYKVESANGTKTYRLAKAAAEITSPARKLVVSALSTGLPTWSCNTTTAAAAQPGGLIPSTHTTTIASGAYFLLQTGGPAEAISAAAIAANVSIGSSTTAGKADDATITGGGIGYSLESAAAGDENVGCWLTVD